MEDNNLSPMMQQYLETKKEYPDSILFYRIGDFYEMFFEDAKTASTVLELVLTGKDCGLEERAPMCGVPFHAAESYITKLVNAGYKVAIGEQVEDPRLAKGLVKRSVIRVVTPSTLSPESLDEKKNNFLMSIFYSGKVFGISVLDITTGEFLATSVKETDALIDEISKYQPSEILLNQDAMEIPSAGRIFSKDRFLVNILPDGDFGESSKRILTDYYHSTAEGLGLADCPEAFSASSCCLRYILETQKGISGNIKRVKLYSVSGFLMIDSQTRRNLELTETIRDKKKKGSLIWVLDNTGTAMGARTLRRFLEEPLRDRDKIIRRQDGIEELIRNYIDREEMSEYISGIYDFERLLSKVFQGSLNPRDLVAMGKSFSLIPHIRRILEGFSSDILKDILSNTDPLTDLSDLIQKAITDDPPVSNRDGGFIRQGFNEKIDEYMEAGLKGKTWLLELEEKERERTGIKSLKIKYNRIFGYLIEVTNTYKTLVPEEYVRRQTLSNAERYSMKRLEELQDLILGASEKQKTLEYEIFMELRDRIEQEKDRIRRTAESLALLDTLISLSKAAQKYHYVRPSINTEGRLIIREGRHPVIERLLPQGEFVANDASLDCDSSLMIITGPNMGGKSTYMRQTALISLMALIGSFVPAKMADIPLTDRIFTRVGASDDLSQGMSTFMVEMNEVANILRNATRDSLVILDEIGRGTSTFDGLAIAWSVAEFIQKKLRSKTLFATHYHELTDLEGRLEGTRNFSVSVLRENGKISFLRKIVPGGMDESYGVDVARLAGVPEEVLKRAEEIVKILEQEKSLTSGVFKEESTAEIFEKEPTAEIFEKEPAGRKEKADSGNLYSYLEKININMLTPLEALNILYEIKEKYGKSS